MPELWSLEEYCSFQKDLLVHNPSGLPSLDADEPYWAALLGETHNNHATTRQFLADLNLPTVHPFCIPDHPQNFDTQSSSIPPMGALNVLAESKNHATNFLETLVTLWYMVAPALLAMGELWLRLFSGLMGPLGILYLCWCTSGKIDDKPPTTTKLSIAVVLTVSSCIVLMTDTLYVLQNGKFYGLALFASSLVVSLRLCIQQNLFKTRWILGLFVLLAAHLVAVPTPNGTIQFQFGDDVDDVLLKEGLYYDKRNSFVNEIANHWPKSFRTYDREHGATPWMPTGDSRTGLPFIIHKYQPDQYPNWKRVFLEVQDDRDSISEFVALDISFPETGHDPTKPVYLVLHGLHGGSMEEYIRDLTIRRNRDEKSTVIVMIARGLMDTPIRGPRVFHGARTSDAHAAATILRKVLKPDQILVGAGYSMGAIILANYVANSGPNCALDAAVAVSGGLDMRYQEHFTRAQRLWQPMLAGTLRDKFLLGKFGHRVKEHLSSTQYLRTLRATHITEIDRYAVVPLNGFDDLDHYYRNMSALGDIPHDPVTDELVDENHRGKIHDVSIPLLVVHAFDDPLITWRATVQNSGFMHPENLVTTGSGNLMLLLTRAGGHVGWALGLWPTTHKWKWMSDVVISFAQSVDRVKKSSSQRAASIE